MNDPVNSNLFQKGHYAILKHTISEGFHFDLVLDGEPLCPTYQSSSLELTGLKRIKDHRKKYLNFEGLISPEKGSVVIIEKGEYELGDDHKLKLICKSNATKEITLESTI